MKNKVRLFEKWRVELKKYYSICTVMTHDINLPIAQLRLVP